MFLYWTGTDSLMMVDLKMRKLRKRPYWWLYRFLIKLLDPFIQGHFCVSENVANNIRKFGTKKPITVKPKPILYQEPFPKQEHEGFNVLFYMIKGKKDDEFNHWLYGYDTLLRVKAKLSDFKNVHFIELHDDTSNMSKIYPIVDLYIRPNRHDGGSRMVRECELNNIPVFKTCSPYDIEMVTDEIVSLIKQLLLNIKK